MRSKLFSLVVLCFFAALRVTAANAATPVCDDSTDDASTINAEIKSASTLCGRTVTLPSGRTCKINSPLVFTTCTGFNGNGSVLDAKGIPAGQAAIDVKATAPGVNYGGNRVPYENIDLIGPGPNASGPTGILVEASNLDFEGLNISGLTNGISFGNYGYLASFRNFQIYNNYIGVYYPQGLTDAGENIMFTDGVIFNSPYGLDVSGGEFAFDGVSFDFDTNPIVNYNAQIRVTHGHFEGGYSQAPIQMPWAVQDWVSTVVTDSSFLTDSYIDIPLINITGGFAKFENDWIAGFSSAYTTPPTLVTGAGSNQVSICGMTSSNGPINNVPNIGTCP